MSDRPLWKLLLACKNPHSLAERPLNCGECFTILEYLADMFNRDESGLRVTAVRQATQKHLGACPDCYDYYLRQLRILESVIADHSSVNG